MQVMVIVKADENSARLRRRPESFLAMTSGAPGSLRWPLALHPIVIARLRSSRGNLVSNAEVATSA